MCDVMRNMSSSRDVIQSYGRAALPAPGKHDAKTHSGRYLHLRAASRSGAGANEDRAGGLAPRQPAGTSRFLAASYVCADLSVRGVMTTAVSAEVDDLL